jgi:predicted PurR-regulated permease PerM
LATIATVFFFRAAAQLLIPIVLAVLISYVLEPLVAWLVRHRVPRVAGTSIVLLTLLGLAGWGAASLRNDAIEAIDALPEVARRARELVLSQTGNGPGASIQEAAAELSGGSTETVDKADGKPPAQSAEGEGVSFGEGAVGLFQRGASYVLAIAGHVTVIFFLVFFLLLSGHHVRTRLLEVAGGDADRRRTVIKIVDDINAQIERFLLVRLVTAVIVGALTWAVLAWLGVQNAAVWGVLAGTFNSIPYFGPIIVSGGLLIVGLVQGGGTTQALQMAGAALAITSLEGWLLTPPLMGKAERMSAVAVFLGLLVWTWIWGAWGTLLAVPMLVVIKSVADHVPRLKPVGRLMAP